MKLNVTSEIGKLKSVLVHLPGREIDTMIPPMMADLLFDDILFGQVAREEHRRFQQLIRFIAEEVFDIQDLLEEIFEDEDVRFAVIRDLARRNQFGRRLTVWLRQQKPSVLAEVLIGGIVNEKDKSGDLPTFDLNSGPNYFFTRDPQAVLGHGCLISPPVILPGGHQAGKVTLIDLTKKSLTFAPQKSLLQALKKQGMELDPIYCGGKRAIDQQREQWTDGANAFTLAPGVILLYERNVRTAEELAAHGYHIVYEDDLLLGRNELETWTDKKYAIQIQGHELSRARGGPRCMTMPLEREDV